MKKILILFVVLYGFVSFAQEENTAHKEPIRITLQKQSTPSYIKATTTSMSNKADNIDSKAPVVNIIATKSTTSRGKKATIMSIAGDKTHKTKASNVKTISITVERSSKPQALKATAIKTEQKQ